MIGNVTVADLARQLAPNYLAGRPERDPVLAAEWLLAFAETLLHAEAEAKEAADMAESIQPEESTDGAWHAVGGGAFAAPFGTVRRCLGCDCLVAGGPTRCGRCVGATGPRARGQE